MEEVEMVKNLTVLLLIPLILLAISGVVYTHWSDEVEIIAVVETGRWTPRIGSYKIVTPVGYDEQNPVSGEITDDGLSLVVSCVNVSAGWVIWVAGWS